MNKISQLFGNSYKKFCGVTQSTWPCDISCLSFSLELIPASFSLLYNLICQFLFPWAHFYNRTVLWVPKLFGHLLLFSFFFSMARHPLLATAYSLFRFRDHTQAPLSIGLLWTRNRPVKETSTWLHTTLTRYPCPRRDTNSQSQQANGHRTTSQTAQSPGSAHII